MKRKRLRFGRGFRVAVGNRRAQAAEMVLEPGKAEGSRDNRHRGADQWLYVISGTGVARVNGVRVVLTDRVTDLSGGVTNDRGQPVTEFVVVLQPAEELPPPALRRFLRTARPDQDGKFGLLGLPPAEYIATAVESLEQGGEWDPEYRLRLRDTGRRFSVKEGESIQLDLPLSGL